MLEDVTVGRGGHRLISGEVLVKVLENNAQRSHVYV